MLREQLEALANQTYDGPWELIVVDNGSVDDTREVVCSFQETIPHLRLVDASMYQGWAYGRNRGAEVAIGEAFAFCDHDDIVRPGWLAALAGALDRSHLVIGRFRSLNHMGSGDDNTNILNEAAGSSFFGFLPYGLAANLGVSRQAYEEVNGFDEQLPASADVDFCWRVQLAGYPLQVEPSAVVAKRRRARVVDAWRQHYRYGNSHPILFKKFKRYGMPRNLIRAGRQYGWLLLHGPFLLSADQRAVWVRVAAEQLGRLVGSIHAATIYL